MYVCVCVCVCVEVYAPENKPLIIGFFYDSKHSSGYASLNKGKKNNVYLLFSIQRERCHNCRLSQY